MVPLPDGTVNDVYRVETAAGCFVLRVDGPAWRRPGVDRGREAQLHAVAAAAGSRRASSAGCRSTACW
ncbi:MAG: hypothetical protein U1F06_08340 [Steroidobacteraceae bacterium]